MTGRNDTGRIVVCTALLALSVFLLVQATIILGENAPDPLPLSRAVLAAGLGGFSAALLVLVAAPLWIGSGGPIVFPRVVGVSLIGISLTLLLVGGLEWLRWGGLPVVIGLVAGLPLAVLRKDHYVWWSGSMLQRITPLYDPLMLSRAALLTGFVIGASLSVVFVAAGVLSAFFAQGYDFLAVYAFIVMGVLMFAFIAGPFGLLYFGSVRMPRILGVALFVLGGLLTLLAFSAGPLENIGTSRMLLLAGLAYVMALIHIVFGGKRGKETE